MALMNPYYTHESHVGPVYDVAHFSRSKSIVLAFAALCFATAVGTCAAYFWDPDLIVPHPSEVFADAHQDTRDLIRQHSQGVRIGVGIAVLFALFCFVLSISCIYSAIAGNYYVRVGQGGISLRVPGFVIPFQSDIPWWNIAKLTVVQEKQLGSLSRNAGNIGGELQLRLQDRSTHIIPLDQFREDAWLIYERIMEAREMQLAESEPSGSETWSDHKSPLASVGA